MAQIHPLCPATCICQYHCSLMYLCYIRSYRLIAKTSSNNNRKIPVKCQHTQAVTSVTLCSSQNLSPRALVGFLICVSEVWGLVTRGKAGEALKGKAVTVGLWYVWVQLNVLNFIVHHVLLKVTYLYIINSCLKYYMEIVLFLETVSLSPRLTWNSSFSWSGIHGSAPASAF